MTTEINMQCIKHFQLVLRASRQHEIKVDPRLQMYVEGLRNCEEENHIRYLIEYMFEIFEICMIIDDKHASNAQLFAAAPELLAILGELINDDIYIDADGYAHIDTSEEVVIAARGLISKLDGGLL